MERDEAAKSGLEIRLYSQYPPEELMKAAGNDSSRMLALRFQRMFADIGLSSGRLGVYGMVEISGALTALTHLQ
jgi:hypothetical protein